MSDRDGNHPEGGEGGSREEELEREVLGELDALDEDLLRQLAEDERLESGIPADQRGGDDEFIQMTGLSAPAEDTPQEEDAAPGPISFYEEGVADVDDAMEPGETPEPLPERQVPAPEPRAEPAPPANARPLQPEPRRSEYEEPPDRPPAHNPPPPSGEGGLAAQAAPGEPSYSHRGGSAGGPPPRRTADPREDFESRIEGQDTEAAWYEDGEEDEPPRSAKRRRPKLAPYRIDKEEEGGPPRVNNARRRRSGSRNRRRLQRRLAIAAAVVLGVAAGLLILLVAAQSLRRSGPQGSMRQAEALLEEGSYAQASQVFFNVALGNPNHPRAAEALFMSAFALQRSGPETTPSDQALQTASDRFARFVEQFPSSPKAPRARVMQGLLAYRLGDYQKAVNILGDPALRSADPKATLAILRTLGRAYFKMGEVRAGRSCLLQAASLPINAAPDEDYGQLGIMYAQRAATASGEMQKDYADKAFEAWRMAEETPSASKQEIQAIQVQAATLRQMVEGEAGEGTEPSGTAPPMREAHGAESAGEPKENLQ